MDIEIDRKLRKIFNHCKSNSRKQNIFVCDNWKSTEDFINDNKRRYKLALKKWANYNKVNKPRNGQNIEFKNSKIRFIIKNKGKGYTKKNTVFTSPSDCMKYHKNTHKYIFENKLLGTRDIQNILKKRGIYIEMEMITERLRKGRDLFKPSKYAKFNHKGKQRTILEVAKYENVKYTTLLSRLRKFKTIELALQSF